MKRWLRCLCWAGEIIFVLVVVYFEPSQSVRGFLRGEAFYEGRSASWWRGELAHWELIEFDIEIGSLNSSQVSHIRHFSRTPTKWQQFVERFRNRKKTPTDYYDGPPLLRGDGNARPILLALKDDPNPAIRNLVEIGLRDPNDERRPR